MKLSGTKRTAVDGPFPETEELPADSWILELRSIDEAVQRIKKAPMGDDAEVEIRHVFEADDSGEAFTPELRALEDRQRARMYKQKRAASN